MNPHLEALAAALELFSPRLDPSPLLTLSRRSFKRGAATKLLPPYLVPRCDVSSVSPFFLALVRSFVTKRRTWRSRIHSSVASVQLQNVM
jgi:hypothetical protein